VGVREVVRLGDPLLRRAVPAGWQSELDLGGLEELSIDLIATLREADGVGIAAPQIGSAARLIALEIRPGNRYGATQLLDSLVVSDPEIEIVGASTAVTWEGCLSLPGLRGPVRRSQEVVLRGSDPSGAPLERPLRGFPAVVAQHEVDHLDGVLFIDRMESLELLSFEDEFHRFHEAGQGRQGLSEGSEAR
jgi:peptide deformylase